MFPVVKGKYAYQKLSRDFDSLAELARGGDKLAIEALLDGLNTCNPVNRDFSRNQAALNASIEQLQSPEHVLARQPEERNRAIQRLVSTFDHCGELTDQQLASTRSWIELGADFGVWSAISSYEVALMPDDAWRQGYAERVAAHRERTLQLYDQQIRLGNETALLYRGLSMYRGFSGGGGDNVGALSYLLAFRVGARFPDTMADRRISEISSLLNDDQRILAQNRADEIRRNCCSK